MTGRKSRVKRANIQSYEMRLAKLPCPHCGTLWLYKRIIKSPGKKVRTDFVCMVNNHVLTGKYTELAQDLDEVA